MLLCRLITKSNQYNLISQSVKTEQNRFGQKTDEIAKFSILDGKWNSQNHNLGWTEFGRKMGKWPTDHQKKN